MNRLKVICIVFTAMLSVSFLLSSCNVQLDVPIETAIESTEATEATEATEDVSKGDIWGEYADSDSKGIVHCANRSEYLAFLESDQCPSQFYVPLDLFAEYGELEYFLLSRYNGVSDRLEGQYRFLGNDIVVDVWVRFNFTSENWWSNPFFEVISDENMPENFVFGKSLAEYWGDVLMADVAAGKIEAPWNSPEPYNYMRGNYYPITENVRVFYEGEYLSWVDLFGFLGGKGPVIHLNMDEATQIWIAPLSFDREMSWSELYEIFRAESPLMDRLLTKSTSKAAAEELYNLWKDALK